MCTSQKGSSWQKDIKLSRKQQHKEILFHTHAHKHTEYAHSHRAALSVFIFVPIER